MRKKLEGWDICILMTDSWAFQVVLVVKNPATSAGNIRDTGLTPGLGIYPGGGYGNPLQCSCLENPMDREAWWAVFMGSQRVRHD